ncbi:hypothetical protein IWW55_003866, partial [Coemansia sp. RSA 2706]
RMRARSCASWWTCSWSPRLRPMRWARLTCAGCRARRTASSICLTSTRLCGGGMRRRWRGT